MLRRSQGVQHHVIEQYKSDRVGISICVFTFVFVFVFVFEFVFVYLCICVFLLRRSQGVQHHVIEQYNVPCNRTLQQWQCRNMYLCDLYSVIGCLC